MSCQIICKIMIFGYWKVILKGEIYEKHLYYLIVIGSYVLMGTDTASN